MTSWSWVSEPVAGQPFDRPFAFALVTLDGADAPFIHALDAASPDEVSTGMRVQVRWADERIGAITDIACFELKPKIGWTKVVSRRSLTLPPQTAPGDSPKKNPVTGVITPVESSTTSTQPRPRSRRSTAASPRAGSSASAAPPARRSTCRRARHARPTAPRPATRWSWPGNGTVTTFCIVNVPFLGQRIKLLYVSAYVLLDGADIAFLHLILDIPAEEVRMGMRVEAVWKPRDEWGTTIENISHFRPVDEPDADYETYKQHL